MPVIETTSGLIINADQETSILDSAQSENIMLEYSCNNGRCCTCKTKLLRGKIIELKQQALSQDEIDEGFILTCCCAPKEDILIDAQEISALKTQKIQTLPAKINRLDYITIDILEVELRLPPTATFDFIEGQYLDIRQSNKLKRSYSISSPSNAQTLTLLIKKVDKGLFSDYWFNQAKVNDLLHIEGPIGTFFPRNLACNLLFVATGNGIAPIKSMLDQLALATDFKGDVTLVWGNRYPDDFFWQPDDSNLNLDFIPVSSKPTTLWTGKTGYVQDLLKTNSLKIDNTSAYVCGSDEMVKSVTNTLMTLGLPGHAINFEKFVNS